MKEQKSRQAKTKVTRFEPAGRGTHGYQRPHPVKSGPADRKNFRRRRCRQHRTRQQFRNQHSTVTRDRFLGKRPMPNKPQQPLLTIVHYNSVFNQSSTNLQLSTFTILYDSPLTVDLAQVLFLLLSFGKALLGNRSRT